jgi:hypothetical protein
MHFSKCSYGSKFKVVHYTGQERGKTKNERERRMNRRDKRRKFGRVI